MATKKCPVCGVSVKVENLERHMKNQHPRAQVDLSDALTQEEQRAVKEQKTVDRPGLTRGGRRLLIVAGGVVVVLVALTISYPYLFPPRPTETGFSLQSTDNALVSLSAWKGSPVLVEFMDLDCPYCQQEAPVLQSLYQSYSSQGVKFVSIDINFEGTPDTATRINMERTTPGYAFYGDSWPYCLDPGRTVQTNYGVTSTPTIFILHKDGTIYQEYLGTAQASAANLQAGLNAVLGG